MLYATSDTPVATSGSRIGLAVAAMLVTFAAAAASQSIRVGHIERVVGLTSNETCSRTSARPASRDSLSILRGGAEAAAWPRDSAVVRDRLHVRRFTDVHFRVDSGRFGSGDFYLVPELGQCVAPSPAFPVRGTGTTAGSYLFDSRQERVAGRARDRLILSVDNGGAIVEWARGALSVFALGREIRDSGTVFAVVVDSAANRALLFVSEGAVSIVGVSGLRATSGRALMFSRTGLPQPIAVSDAFLNDVRFQRQIVWTQPLQPVDVAVGRSAGGAGFGALVAGAVVVGGGGYLVFRSLRHKKTSGTGQGNIVITIPL